MIFVNAETNSKIHIGRAGEHKTTTVVFDISEWIEELRNEIDPNLGTVELIVEQNSMSYPQLIEYNRKEKKVYWVVTHSNTSEPGVGKCELFYLGKKELTRLFKKPDNWETEYTNYYDKEGNKLVEGASHEWKEEWKNYSDSIPYFYMARPTLKTALYEIIVTNALGYNEEEPPEPYESWIDNVLNASTDIKQAGDEAVIARDQVIVAKNETVAARDEAVDNAAAALASQTAASESASAAADSATSASTSASAASESAAAAAASERAAKASEEAAKASETAAKASETAAAGSASAARDAQLEATAQATNSASSAAAALECKQAALKYVSNPPQPRSDTGTWWIYDPVNDNYFNSHEPYGIRIHRIFESVEEMNAFTPEVGVNAAINIPATDTENEHSEIYVYTEIGWKYLLSMVGGGGDGNMKDKVYDPGGPVAKAGGIPNYVKENATQVTWNKWTSGGFIG